MPDQSEAPIVRKLLRHDLFDLHGSTALVNPDGAEAAEIIRLCMEALEATDDFIINELAADMPTMDFCNANPEAGDLLLRVRTVLAQIKGQNP